MQAGEPGLGLMNAEEPLELFTQRNDKVKLEFFMNTFIANTDIILRPVYDQLSTAGTKYLKHTI